MYFPRMQETSKYRDMTTVFGGYNRQISLNEGEFFDMQNMTSKYFPILSPRNKRGIVKNFTNPQGILDKEDLWWIDDKKLYRNGEGITLKGVKITDESPKAMAKMGAYIIIMPDRIWCKAKNQDTELECGYMEASHRVYIGSEISFSTCKANGEGIDWKDSQYYEENDAKDGDYQMSVNSEGRPSLKVYSASTGIWLNVTSTYMRIKATGIGKNFEKEDGIKITCNYNGDSLDNIFINTEDDGYYSTNTYIVDKSEDWITIPGIYKGRVEPFEDISLLVERKVPDMEFITECNNRLWGCSKDGHEVYCCKLGDVKNWNCFRGNSTDSWAATVGSDGKFTGAITYLGYPMFFKEDSFLKIAVSSVGGHQTKETMCRGVQKGSSKSLNILNEVLYYKSPSGVCSYNGSLPYSISDALGDINYYDASAGVLGDKYYISMRDNDNVSHMFAYDTKTGIWCKEDNTNALMFCKHDNELYFIDEKDKKLKSVGGKVITDFPEKAIEEDVKWFVESGPIGYSSPDKKFLARISLRFTLDFGAEFDLYLQYDSSGEWVHVFNICGTGTRTYSVPIIPQRCDHFKYKIKGKGNCKIHSITKTIEEGSEF